MRRVSPGRILTSLSSAVLTAGLLLPASTALATPPSNSERLSTPQINSSSITYTTTLSSVTLSGIKCINLRLTDTIGSNSKPTGMDITSASLDGSSNYIPTPGSWSLSANNSTGNVSLTDAGGETPASSTARTIVLTGITNGSVADTTYYAEIGTYDNTDCSTSPVDMFRLAFVFTDGVLVAGDVTPSLGFSLSSTSCSLGTLSSVSTSSCSHTIDASTNASSGYTISYLAAADLTSGSNSISDSGSSGATSATGTEQFGLNLKNNATPDVGAEPSGGSGAASAHYDTADTFSFNTSGAEIANSTGFSTSTTYTATYVANISTGTKAGTYATTIIYNVTANY